MAASFNGDSTQSLANQWELVVLHALSSVGRVSHEPDLGGRCRLDAVLDLDLPGPGCEVGLEVTAVSDQAVRDLNPIDDFMAAVYAGMRKLGLRLHGLDLEIGSRFERSGKKARVVLAIPEKRDRDSFVKDHVIPFLEQIAADPSNRHAQIMKHGLVDIVFGYNPNQEGTTMHYLGYDTDLSLADNSVARALDKKAAQIRRSGFSGPAVVVVCDAGAPLFGQAQHWHRVTPAEVVYAFLANHPEVAGVALLNAHSYDNIPPLLDFRANPTATKPLDEAALRRLQEALSRLPRTAVGVLNARPLLRRLKGRQGLTLSRGVVESRPDEHGRRTTITRMSARDLVSVLAGSVETLRAFGKKEIAAGVFADAVKHGCRLVGVRFLEIEDADDDWIEFEFRERDPAWLPIEPE